MGCRGKLCDAYYMEFERCIRDHLFAAGATPGGRVSKPVLQIPGAVGSISCGTRDSRLSMAGSQAGFGPAGLDLQTVFDPGSPATLSRNSVAKMLLHESAQDE